MQTPFDNEPIEQIPNSNEIYNIADYDECTNFTYLMKLVLLTRKYPDLNNKIKDYKEQINMTTSTGITALMFSCYFSSTLSTFETVEELIKHGAELNKIDCNGETALMHASRNTESCVKTVRELIKNGADINRTTSKYRFNVLMNASFHGKTNVQIIQELINCEIDVNKEDKDGDNSLMLLCNSSEITKNKINIAKELIKANVNVNKINNYGWAALPMLCHRIHVISGLIEIYEEIIEELLKAGADIGNKINNKSIFDILLEKGKDVYNSIKYILIKYIKKSSIDACLETNDKEIISMLYNI